MSVSRRNFVAFCGLAAGGAVFSTTAKNGVENALAPNDPDEGQFTGYAPAPEFTVDAQTGELTLGKNQQVSYSVCMDCTTLCGVRVRLDKETG